MTGLLAKFFGYRSFRPGQREVIDAVLAGRDAVVLMPTGGGKSICYQIPALASPEGVALVISPLIALMQDQTQTLVANGVPAAAIHSNQDEAYNRSVIDAAYAGKLKLLYMSPETLLQNFDNWKRLTISLVAIDEAHCISQWGHDFRPDYTGLHIIKDTMPHVPVIALTATADRLTRDDIVARLHLHKPFCYTGSFDRPNISLSAYPNPGAKERVRFIAAMTRKYPHDSGIAYCLSRNGAERTHAALLALGIRSACYHAGMSADAREDALQAFLNGTVQVVCATVAFGMGIDKSNIRWVVHCNMPGTIENYYQEVGRAGRDGLPAEAVLFYSYADVITLRKFAEESGQQAINLEKLQRMQAYAEARVCRRRILLSYFSEESICDCGNCDVCLHPPGRFDGTIVAQKALSAVMRTGGDNIGIYTLVDILRGQRQADIVRKAYDKIPTFGVGADLSRHQWLDVIRQLIQLGLLELLYEKGNRLRPTPYGMRVLRGQERLQLSVYEPPQAAAKAAKNKNATAKAMRTDNRTLALFEYLKTIRTQVARKEKQIPYRVFNDATLLDMAARRPLTLSAFLQVNGVGERKAARYWGIFTDAIRKFDA